MSVRAYSILSHYHYSYSYSFRYHFCFSATSMAISTVAYIMTIWYVIITLKLLSVPIPLLCYFHGHYHLGCHDSLIRHYNQVDVFSVPILLLCYFNGYFYIDSDDYLICHTLLGLLSVSIRLLCYFHCNFTVAAMTVWYFIWHILIAGPRIRTIIAIL